MHILLEFKLTLEIKIFLRGEFNCWCAFRQTLSNYFFLVFNRQELKQKSNLYAFSSITHFILCLDIGVKMNKLTLSIVILIKKKPSRQMNKKISMFICSINLSTFLKLTLLCYVLADYAHNFFNLLP